MKSFTFAGVIVLACAITASGQTFSSGSTGADGALTVGYGGGLVVVQLPESGILNYTTIDNGQYAVVRFRKNSQNTPVMLLASGNVNILGTIDVSSGETNPHGDYDCSAGGPGGFDGARLAGQRGQGPAAGLPGTDNRARWVGPLTLVPALGGSGGGAGTWDRGCGGGGAVVIASSGTMTIANTGVIDARANPQYSGGWICVGGAGGAIRLVANGITAAGGLYATGARAEADGLPGNPGLIRLEAPAGSLTWTGIALPPAVQSAINPALSAGPAPLLSITSIGGFPVPPMSGMRLDMADLVLPRQLTDPVAVVVTASNIPVGTTVAASFGAGGGTVTPATLAGTVESSTATLQISGMARDGSITFLYVTAVFAMPGGAGGANPPGPDHVVDVRVRAEPGRPATYAFLRADGTEINPALLPRALVGYFSR